MDEGDAGEKVAGAAPAMAAWMRAYRRPDPLAPATMPALDGPPTRRVCIQVLIAPPPPPPLLPPPPPTQLAV